MSKFRGNALFTDVGGAAMVEEARAKTEAGGRSTVFVLLPTLLEE